MKCPVRVLHWLTKVLNWNKAKQTYWCNTHKLQTKETIPTHRGIKATHTKKLSRKAVSIRVHFPCFKLIRIHATNAILHTEAKNGWDRITRCLPCRLKHRRIFLSQHQLEIAWCTQHCIQHIAQRRHCYEQSLIIDYTQVVSQKVTQLMTCTIFAQFNQVPFKQQKQISGLFQNFSAL